MDIRILEDKSEICGWPTECFHLDWYDVTTNRKISPHTVLMFVPGNPGCSGWYIQLLKMIMQRLGVGYAARAVSYAGHGVDSDVVLGSNIQDNRTGDKKIAWTVNGQIDHKIEWVDLVTMEFLNDRSEMVTMDGDADTTSTIDTTILPEFVFISHSIGAHLVQRLCILRKDVLVRTRAIIHLMPFFRFDPYPRWKNSFLSTVANAPDISLRILHTASKIASFLPKKMIDTYLENIAGISVKEDRELARGLLTNPDYARNFLTLGMEEIRDLPAKHDTGALKIIGEHSPSYILYCGNVDQWAPKFHMEEMHQSIKTGIVPNNITLAYVDELQHDFVVYPDMHGPVVDFAYASISHANSLREQEGAKSSNKIHLTSKL